MFDSLAAEFPSHSTSQTCICRALSSITQANVPDQDRGRHAPVPVEIYRENPRRKTLGKDLDPVVRVEILEEPRRVVVAQVYAAAGAAAQAAFVEGAAMGVEEDRVGLGAP